MTPPDFIDIATKIASLVLSLGAMLYAFVATRRGEIDTRLKEGQKRMDRHDIRIHSLEQTVTSLPGKDHMHKLELQLAEVNGSLQAMSVAIEGSNKIMARMETILNRHEDHLIGERR